MSQPALFVEPKPPEPSRFLVDFLRGMFDTWFETRTGRKPKKAERAQTKALAQTTAYEFEALAFAAREEEEVEGDGEG